MGHLDHKRPDNPFVVGVEVAVEYAGRFQSVKRIGKVHKTGRFLLEGDTRQFYPTCFSAYGKKGLDWSADECGATGRYSRTALRPYTPELRARYASEQAEKCRKERQRDLVEKLRLTSELSDSQLDAIEAALTVAKEEVA